MAPQPDSMIKKFKPLLDKTLKNALAHRISKEFPRIGGPRIQQMCAELVLEVINDHLRPHTYVMHGQILWMGISVNDPPSRGKKIADTDLVPVILDVSTPDDVQSRIERISPMIRLEKKAVRLCHQAFKQGALLSNCDLAEIVHVDATYISYLICRYEKRTGKVVPRRATVHDVGSGLTHKRIICRKRYIEGKPPEDVAKETHHSLEAVDRYLAQYDRVRHCRLQGLGPEQTAYTLNCSISLVHEYLRIDKEMETKND